MHTAKVPNSDLHQEDVLYLDLSRDARRSAILSQLSQTFDIAQREAYSQVCSRIRFPQSHYKNLTAVHEAIGMQDIDEATKDHARAVYRILAEAEASVHACTLEDTHFHEVGNADALKNALCICIAFVVRNAQIVHASPVQTGSGQIECSHGTLSIPAPATAAILARGVPLAHTKLEGELCTPTSAALIFHFVDAFIK